MSLVALWQVFCNRRGSFWQPITIAPVTHRSIDCSQHVCATGLLAVFDDFDCRSPIDNTLFREGKQTWSLESIPKKTQRAAAAHSYITFVTLAMTTAYRSWSELEKVQEDLMSPIPDEPHGARRWRRELRKKNEDRVIVFCDGYYGIFHVAEFTVLTGFRIRRIPPELGTIQEIYER